MEMQELFDKYEINELVNKFASLADTKEIQEQVDLFAEAGYLEFQRGFDGEIHTIKGKERLVNAFTNTVGPAKSVCHCNGQCIVSEYNGNSAEGIAYCTATLLTEENGKEYLTTNYVRYSDSYIKVEGKWYIAHRRTTFLMSDKREYAARY